MKAKLIQILLGAVGSVISVLITHYAGADANVAMGVALGAGPITTTMIGGLVRG